METSLALNSIPSTISTYIVLFLLLPSISAKLYLPTSIFNHCIITQHKPHLSFTQLFPSFEKEFEWKTA
jgi:hypothetical protein